MGSESIAHDVVLFWENKQTPPQLLVLSLVFYPINPKRMLATYAPSMRIDSLEIRIKGPSCRPQQ